QREVKRPGHCREATVDCQGHSGRHRSRLLRLLFGCLSLGPQTSGCWFVSCVPQKSFKAPAAAPEDSEMRPGKGRLHATGDLCDPDHGCSMHGGCLCFR
ncbi:YSL6, partial [Symbiodinium pilosum]